MLSVSKSVLLYVFIAILMVLLGCGPFSTSENETEIVVFNSEQNDSYTVHKGNKEEIANWVIQKRIAKRRSVTSMKNKKLYNFKARLSKFVVRSLIVHRCNITCKKGATRCPLFGSFLYFSEKEV